VGVAPGAEWIAAKIFDDNDQATTAGIHQSFQWILDPDGDPATADAPDVVNSSWAMPSPGCDLEFQPDLQALLAAGILPVFAAGNYGPNTGTAASPANYPEALAVGASDNAGTVQSFSSRGPSSCGEPQGTPQSTFPEVVAPGLDIKAPDLLGGYAYASGTSLAAPHAAGALALLLDADPSLTAAQQREALTASATDVGAAGPDDASGYGLINARSAYDYVRTNFWSLPPDTTPPVISADPAPPASGSVNGAQSVALSSDGGEKVRYTTDGTVPDYTSKLYDGTRINITRTATIRAYAIDAAGNRADASFSYTVRQPTAITLDATRTRLDFGQGTTLSGTLTSNGAPLARKTVEIEQRPVGASAFVSVPNGAVETGADGGFSLSSVKPRQNTEYRAVFAEQPELQSCAMGRRVDVRVMVSAKLSASTVRPGRGVTISGYVRPSHTGSVEVEIKHGGAVVKRKTASLDGDSHYSLRYTPRPVGKYTVSVSYSGHTDHLGGVSPARHFLVSG
ncbi:MAG TPA: S8 family serine peptidase, partial [Rubrobacteraceae bacterium]|nr:S8 family serine peptidase [Rubrobacteraceae bacterium]